MKLGKSRLTHGQESQCAKRLNDGLPGGGSLDGKTSINNYIMLNGNHYWRGKNRLISDVTMLKPKIPYTPDFITFLRH